MPNDQPLQCPRIQAETIAESEEVSRSLAGPPGGTFASLRHRHFLIFWVGSWVSNIGTWLQMIAVGWLVLEMTDSSLYLGLVNFAMSIPVFFLSFPAGILADRLDKRKLIMAFQVVLMVAAFILGGLVSLNLHTVWLIMLITFLGGIAFTFVFPAWQAIISELVPRHDLLNAIALNSAQFHSARLLGPPLAGFLIAAWGVAACFYLNSVSFLSLILALLIIRQRRAPARPPRKGWDELKDGFCYVINNRRVLFLLLGVGVVSVFGLSFFSTLMPKFARDVLHGDARTLGFLMGANGLGALGGALTLARLSYAVRRSTVIRHGMAVFSVSLMVFAFSRSLPLSLAAMAVTGFAFLSVMATLNTALQSEVPQEIRGRIMSFYVWMFMGWTPLGSLLSGLLAHSFGSPATVALGAAVPLCLSLYLLVRPPRFNGPGARVSP